MVTSAPESKFRNPCCTDVIDYYDRCSKSVAKRGTQGKTLQARHIIGLPLYSVLTFAELRNGKPYPLYVKTCAESAIIKDACLFYDSIHNVQCL